MDYSNYVCSNCGARASYDGRCGDGPFLTCECVSQKNSTYVPDRCGGYTVYLNDAHPVPAGKKAVPEIRYVVAPSTSQKNWDDWGRDDD